MSVAAVGLRSGWLPWEAWKEVQIDNQIQWWVSGVWGEEGQQRLPVTWSPRGRDLP